MKKLPVLILVSLFALSSGSLWAEDGAKPAAEDKVSLMADPSKAKGSELYSCPMHPEVQQDKEGKCPMCGKNLEKTVDQAGSEKKQGSEHEGHEHK